MDSWPSIQAWPPLRSAPICSTRWISDDLWLEWLSACLELHPLSQKYFGSQWLEFFMVFHTLLFCASIYHKLGLAVFGAARSLGGFQFYNTLMISTLDRFLFLHYELCGTRLSSEPKQQLILCYLLIEARCFIGIKKKINIFFSTWVRFQGFICDSSSLRTRKSSSQRWG